MVRGDVSLLAENCLLSSVLFCCIVCAVHCAWESLSFGFGGNGGGLFKYFCGDPSELIDVTTAALLYKLSAGLWSLEEPDDEVDIWLAFKWDPFKKWSQ